MKFLIIGESFSGLQPWLYYDQKPKGMPAVYHLLKFLGKAEKHSFDCIIINKKVNRIIHFPNGSKLYLYRLRLPNHYLWKFFSFFYAYLLAVKKIKRSHYDLIYTLSFYNLLSSVVGRRFSLFSVSRKYGNQMYAAVENKNYLKIYTRFLFETLAFKYPADLTIVTRDGTQSKKLATYFNPSSQVFSLFNGIDLRMKQSLLSLKHVEKIPVKEDLKMVCIARLDSSKRQDLAILLVEKLVYEEGISNIRLDLVGEGPQSKNLDKLILQKKLQNFIKVKPPVPHDAIPDLLSKYHISVFCYDKGVMGNVLWESMLGARLILARASGEASIIDDKNAIKVADNEFFLQEAAYKVKSFLGKDVTNICHNARTLASELIQPWEDRFKIELDLIAVEMGSKEG